MVTSRAADDDLVKDEDTQPADVTSDVTAPPRRQARKPAAKSGPGKVTPPDGKQDAPVTDAPPQDVKANGAAAAKGTDRPAPVDATVVDGIPALPADTVGSPREARPKDTGPKDTGPAAGRESGAPGSSVFSFGPPPAAPAKPALEDPVIAYPAETAARPPGDATAPPSTGSSSGATSAGTGSPAPKAAEASSVPPAAFAWEMPDPPADSPSSPARAFLRSGLTARNPAPAPAPVPVSTAPPAPAAPSATSDAPARDAAKGSPAKGSPVTLGPPRSPRTGPAKSTRPKAQQKAQSKRSARQAHLTISRVEPWSVMKFSFVVSLVAFVILFVAVTALYGALSGLGVFDSLQRVVTSVTSSQGSTGVNAKAWFSASRVLGYTALLGALNIVLITAMSTIGSVVYNLTSRLVGGVEVTLRETE
jgi:hypothetical protein